MSDPRLTDPYADPRSSDARLNDPVIRQEIHQDGSSSGMWGWIAGVAVLALIAFVVIAGWSGNQDTASNNASPPAATTTGSAPAANPPATTGSGATTPAPAQRSMPAPAPQAPPANR